MRRWGGVGYRTVNLKPATHRRLAAYKVAGITFDDAVGLLMDEVTPQAIKERVLQRLADEQGPGTDEDAEDATVEFLETRRSGRGAAVGE